MTYVIVGCCVLPLLQDAATQPQPEKADNCRMRRTTAKENAIRRKLESQVNLYFKEVPLGRALDDLSYLSGLNIVTDDAALKEAGINLDQPLSLKLEDVSLKSALNLLLDKLNLTWVIQDEALKVTTHSRGIGKQIPRMYHVADLVIPLRQHRRDKDGEALKTTEDALIKLITRTVAPQSWADVGGCGTIQYYPPGHVLIVNQPEEIQEQVRELLALLRRAQEVEVASETRTVRAPRRTLEFCLSYLDRCFYERCRDGEQVLFVLVVPRLMVNKETEPTLLEEVKPAERYRPSREGPEACPWTVPALHFEVAEARPDPSSSRESATARASVLQHLLARPRVSPGCSKFNRPHEFDPIPRP